MMKPARVLLIGDDPSYMKIKATVLRHFWPVRLHPVDGDMSHLDTETVVVCSTVPDSERQDLVDRVRQYSPTMLVVKMNGYDSGPHAGADATVDESQGPGALVSTIYGLLTERGLPSRPWPEPGVDADAAWVQ